MLSGTQQMNVQTLNRGMGGNQRKSSVLCTDELGQDFSTKDKELLPWPVGSCHKAIVLPS